MVIVFLFFISWAWIPIVSELVLSLNECIRFITHNVMLICLQMLTMKFIFDLKREVSLCSGFLDCDHGTFS
jgi:hypothetical protein